MDESGIELFHGTDPGNICVNKHILPLPAEPTQRVDSSAQKFGITHVAFVCNNREVQPLLPHILIGAESCFRAQDMQEYLDSAPKNVYLLREKSRWNNETLMLRILKLLSLCLEPVRHRFHIIFSMDCAPCHLGAKIGEACARYGFWLIYIPAQLTFLLQILDTHLFRRYKGFIRRRYQEVRSEVPDGILAVKHLLEILYLAIRVIFEGNDWALAFSKNGCGNNQRDVSQFILKQLCLKEAPQILALKPSEDEVVYTFPRNRPCFYNSIFRLHLRATAALQNNPDTLASLPDDSIPVVHAQRLMPPRRPAPLAQAASSSSVAQPPLALPPPEPDPTPAAAAGCPVTRSQSRLTAALAQGRPLLQRNTGTATPRQQSQ